MKKDIKGIIKKMKKMGVFVMVAAMNLVMTIPVYADTPSIEDLPLYRGTMDLITVITGGLTMIAAAIGVTFSVKAGIAWHAANEQERPAKQKALICTIGSAIVIVCIPGGLTWLLLFY